jgi:NADH-quinone oxidoreductase subunit C
MDQFGALWDAQIEELNSVFGSAIQSVLKPGIDAVDMPTITIDLAKYYDLIVFLKEKSKHRFDFYTDMTAVDHYPDELKGGARFELVVHLFGMESKARIRIKTLLKDQQSVPTLSSLYTGTNWAEREIWDMFGIKFDGHPDLRRILLDLRFKGHPLRKDYPLRGYQIFVEPEPIDPELLR